MNAIKQTDGSIKEQFNIKLKRTLTCFGFLSFEREEPFVDSVKFSTTEE